MNHQALQAPTKAPWNTLLIAALAALFATNAMADRGNRHDYSHRWHGDIHRFHQHDYPYWREGRWHHGHHDGHLGWWWIAGGLWYFYEAPVYPYPDPYVPYTPPVVVVQQPAPPPAAVTEVAPQPQYWYYCNSARNYYPYVAACPEGWRQVPATPQQ